jgi:hypothetical protein
MHVRVSTKTGEITVDHDAMTQVAVQLMKDHPEARPTHVRSGQPVRPGPAPQGVTPAVASPPGPVGSAPGPVGSAPGPVGSAFDTTGGAGTADERIARLRELLDKGILTESEFQAKRQQVLGQA